jgi:hypothetical protein
MRHARQVKVQGTGGENPQQLLAVVWQVSCCPRYSTMPGERVAKKYELWHSESGGGHTFFCSDSPTARRLLEADARLIWTVDAISYADARRKLNEHLDWGPYEPAPEFVRWVEENY